MMDIYAPLQIGFTVWFAQPDAMKGSLVVTLRVCGTSALIILSNSLPNPVLPVSLSAVVQEVKPTVLFGVPRVWEKFREKVEENLLEAKGWKEIVLEKSRVRPLAASTNH